MNGYAIQATIPIMQSQTPIPKPTPTEDPKANIDDALTIFPITINAIIAVGIKVNFWLFNFDNAGILSEKIITKEHTAAINNIIPIPDDIKDVDTPPAAINPEIELGTEIRGKNNPIIINTLPNIPKYFFSFNILMIHPPLPIVY